MSEYDEEEVREILGRAIRVDDEIGLSHAELVEVAEEVGVRVEDLEAAAAEVRDERVDRSDEMEARQRLSKRKARKRRGWLRHLLSWGVVGTGLFLLDMIVPGSSWWFYPVIGWGMVVGLHGVSLFGGDDEEALEREIRRIRKKRERARKEAERAARRKRGKRKKGGDVLSAAEAAFEDAIDRGLALLLTKAAQKLEAAVGEGVPPDTEFGRFVAKKRGRRVPPRVQRKGRAAPHARVEAEGEAEVVEEPARRGRREGERTVD